MLAADAMLRSSRLDVGVPRIRRPRWGFGERLGFRRRSTRREPGTLGEKADSFRWVISCFMDPASRGKKMEVESVRGGEDLWDAESAAQQGGFPEHLVVMVNGLVGSAEDWKFAAEQLVKKLPDKVIVHRSECNSSRLTFDGVDLMGDRLAEEVKTVVKQREGVRKISFVAHSLGGLVARYAIGRLYEPVTTVEFSDGTDEESKVKDICMLGRIAGLEPMNFITFASPHLGSRGHRQLPFLCGLPFLERSASETAHFIVGKTGKHLFLTDKDDGKPPLLLRMVDDCDDIKFRSALRCFKRRVAYANANYDHMVGWRTSSIRRQRELPKHHLLVADKKYPHIVYVDKGDKINTHTEMPIEAPKDELEEGIDNSFCRAFLIRIVPASRVHVDAGPMLEWKKSSVSGGMKEMIRGLSQVPWERVDVSFQKSRQRYIAHNTIQVKSYWLNSDGADVVFHMIDNFLV